MTPFNIKALLGENNKRGTGLTLMHNVLDLME